MWRQKWESMEKMHNKIHLENLELSEKKQEGDLKSQNLHD